MKQPVAEKKTFLLLQRFHSWLLAYSLIPGAKYHMSIVMFLSYLIKTIRNIKRHDHFKAKNSTIASSIFDSLVVLGKNELKNEKSFLLILDAHTAVYLT